MLFDQFPRNWFHRLNFKPFAFNHRDNIIPNLWCFCSNHINPDIISFDNQQVTFTFVDNNLTFCISTIYASIDHIIRRQLWLNLQTLHTQINRPWCAIGDFNSILGSHEHRGATIPARAPMNEFFDWSDSNNFIHLPTRGVQFTWANGRRGLRHTERRLDKVVCNQAWIDVCSSLNVSTLTKHKSDHFPLLLDFETSQHKFLSQFKFMQMCMQHEDCKRVNQEAWNINMVGCSMFILNQKLKVLKQKLKIWNKTIFGNVHSLVKEAEQKLSNIQADIDLLGISNSLMEHQKAAQIFLENALSMEEEFWREKSKVAWHTDGDRNTKYFHKLSKIKNTSKLINSLMIGGNMVTDPQQISSHITEHFKNIFSTNIVVQDLQVTELIEDIIPNMISDELNALLTRPPS